jgi:hypothetical protein
VKPPACLAASVAIATLAVGFMPAAARVAAPPHTDLAGTWVLNRELSEFKTVGFDPVGTPETTDSVSSAGRSRGRGGRGGGVPAPFVLSESEEDYAKRRLAIAEVEQPSASITISQTDATVTITDAQGHARLFHTNGKEEGQPIGNYTTVTTAKWKGPDLVIEYEVIASQHVRYTYSRGPGEPRLHLAIQLNQKGEPDGDAVTRVYDGR